MRYSFFLFFLLFFNLTKGLTIQGSVMDINSKTPVQYATIYLASNIGTITNENGAFILHLNEYKRNESLYVSSIGYISRTIFLNDLDSIISNKIELTPVIYDLKAVEIISTGINPFELLKNAFEKVSINCKKDKHYYKGLYFEQINNYDKIMKWRSRSVNCAVIVEDPGYNKYYNNWLGKIKENIFILGVSKNADSLNYTSNKNTNVNEANYFNWTFEKNYCRYRNDYFSNSAKYLYSIKGSYFDSLFKTTIIQINIVPKNPQKDVIYGEVFVSSLDHKIFKIHILYKSENYNIPKKKNDKYYYKNLNSDIVVLYKPDNNNEMVLSYIKYEFGDGYFSYEQNKPYMIFKKRMEYKTIGEIENGENIIKTLTKMDNSTNIYDQQIINKKSFWLDYNLIIN